MVSLDRYLSANDITNDDFAATLRRRGFKATAGWIRQIRGGHGTPSRRLARGMAEITGGGLNAAVLLGLVPADASASVPPAPPSLRDDRPAGPDATPADGKAA